jgi:hypothetical protein
MPRKPPPGQGKRASPQTSNGCPAEAGRYRRKNFLAGEAASVEIFGWRQSGGKPPRSKGICPRGAPEYNSRAAEITATLARGSAEQAK